MVEISCQNFQDLLVLAQENFTSKIILSPISFFMRMSSSTRVEMARQMAGGKVGCDVVLGWNY